MGKLPAVTELCACHAHTYGIYMGIYGIKTDLCIRSRETGLCAAGTSCKESKNLHDGPWKWVLKDKQVYLLFLLLAFTKNLTFWLLVAGTLGQEEARKGKENGFNYRKKGPVRTGCYNS